MLKDANVFINLKCSFPFDFMSSVLTHDCVVHENEKNMTKARNLMAKEFLVPLTGRVSWTISNFFMKEMYGTSNKDTCT